MYLLSVNPGADEGTGQCLGPEANVWQKKLNVPSSADRNTHVTAMCSHNGTANTMAYIERAVGLPIFSEHE